MQRNEIAEQKNDLHTCQKCWFSYLSQAVLRSVPRSHFMGVCVFNDFVERWHLYVTKRNKRFNKFFENVEYLSMNRYEKPVIVTSSYSPNFL